MAKQERLREAKQHGAAWFPFNIYPCTIPKDFPQVALHWQDSMELVFVKKGRGIVQAGLTTYTAQAGDIYVFAPGVLHALRQLPGEAMEYENIIFELELLGGADNIVDVTNCVTRLRVNVKDETLVADDPDFKSIGTSGIAKNGKGMQVIIGLKVPKVRDRFEALL